MLDVIAETDLAGVIRFATPSYEAATGWSPAELLGHSAFDFIHPEDVDRVREELGRTTRRTGHSSSTYRFRKQDGGWLWADSLVTLVRDEDGEPAGLVITSRDVTAKRRAEEVVALLHETERSLLRRESLDVDPGADLLRASRTCSGSRRSGSASRSPTGGSSRARSPERRRGSSRGRRSAGTTRPKGGGRRGGGPDRKAAARRRSRGSEGRAVEERRGFVGPRRGARGAARRQ